MNPRTIRQDDYIATHFDTHFPKARIMVNRLVNDDVVYVIVQPTVLCDPPPKPGFEDYHPRYIDGKPLLYGFEFGADDDTYRFHKYSTETGPDLIEFPIEGAGRVSMWTSDDLYEIMSAQLLHTRKYLQDDAEIGDDQADYLMGALDLSSRLVFAYINDDVRDLDMILDPALQEEPEGLGSYGCDGVCPEIWDIIKMAEQNAAKEQST